MLERFEFCIADIRDVTVFASEIAKFRAVFSSGVVSGPEAGSSCMPYISVSVSYIDLLLTQFKKSFQ